MVARRHTCDMPEGSSDGRRKMAISLLWKMAKREREIRGKIKPMARQEDVELFLSGVDSWNRVFDVFDQNRAENSRSRPSLRYKADLSETDIGYLMGDRVFEEEDFFFEQATHFPRVDLSFCDLRRTNFRTLVSGFDFREALFRTIKPQRCEPYPCRPHRSELCRHRPKGRDSPRRQNRQGTTRKRH